MYRKQNCLVYSVSPDHAGEVIASGLWSLQGGEGLGTYGMRANVLGFRV